ncbi:MAG: diaminopimelate decarboxylase [Gammaproteobacteria bacterium]|nr:diaminopimelate decarboxylase [Gammaproteobacteria bacterium]
MAPFRRIGGLLYAEQVALDAIAARYGTPCYVYSRAALERNWRRFDQALNGCPHLLCYAVKANSNLAVLQVLARLGSGFDIVSGGELQRVLRAGGKAERTVFSGVGKRDDELRMALEAGIRCFNVESVAELERLAHIAAARDGCAPVALRVNPEIEAGAHAHIATAASGSKFGLPWKQVPELCRRVRQLPGVRLDGLACHIGSQIVSLRPFRQAMRKLLGLAESLAADGCRLRHLNLGGGLGIRYRAERPPSPAVYAAALAAERTDDSLELVLEPGRAVAGPAGILLTRVEYLKHGPERNFAVTDAAMTELLRPALYDAWHEILPVREGGDAPRRRYDIVGPVCESADCLGRDRALSLREGDLLALCDAGAYAAVMGSNYNSRPRPCELLVDGDAVREARRRETIEELMAKDFLPFESAG